MLKQTFLTAIGIAAFSFVGYSQSTISIQNLVISPVPAVDKISIDFTSETEGIIVIDVNDLTGRMPLHVEANATIGQNHLDLDISDLECNVYFLSLINSQSAACEPFIKVE